MLRLEYAPSADEAWVKLIRTVFDEGQDVRPRTILCREILAHTSHVDMSRPITTVRPRLGYKFLFAEAWWILTGRNDVESIRPYSPHIASYSNDGIRFDGSYGPRIVDQLRYVCDTLEADWASRQAVLEIWRPNPRESRDVPCTLTVQWMIRKRVNEFGEESYYLHCFDTMRSSDAWLGWPYDCFNFSMLSAYILLMLRDRDKDRCAGGGQDSRVVGKLKLGNLHLTAASQHLYVDPKQDGVNNIPYSLKDVEEVLAKFPPPAREHKGVQILDTPYQAINLSDFDSASDMLEHLAWCKDQPGVNQRYIAGGFVSS